MSAVEINEALDIGVISSLSRQRPANDGIVLLQMANVLGRQQQTFRVAGDSIGAKDASEMDGSSAYKRMRVFAVPVYCTHLRKAQISHLRKSLPLGR
jgi:hypothetical protein